MECEFFLYLVFALHIPVRPQFPSLFAAQPWQDRQKRDAIEAGVWVAAAQWVVARWRRHKTGSCATGGSAMAKTDRQRC